MQGFIEIQFTDASGKATKKSSDLYLTPCHLHKNDVFR